LLKTHYGFRYKDTGDSLMVIRGIGWESTANEDYRWDGWTRGDKFVAFQYTLSGEGHLIYDGKHYAVPAGHGFFVRIPDRHCYYYQSDSKTPWEFVFLTAEGSHVFSYWNEIVEKNGPVVALDPSSKPIAMLWEMMRGAGDRTLTDKYEISVRLYEWIVSCLRLLDGKGEIERSVPEAVQKARAFMESRYHLPLTLEDIAAAAGASKYHFCRQYLKYAGMTPIQHLNRIRIAEASIMLRETNASIASVAIAAGFDNGSYFGKVFRKLMGVSPQQFRDGSDGSPAKPIFVE